MWRAILGFASPFALGYPAADPKTSVGVAPSRHGKVWQRTFTT
jgi:hypothetical protein